MNRITDYSKLADDITNWIRDYATTNNIKSIVVGVSGGIDSAVVSALCARTGLETHCTILPIYSNTEHTSIALAHCQWLAQQYETVKWALNHCGEAAIGYIEGAIPDMNPHTLANTKSRLRMTILYAIASQCNGIVVGTGNKVEDFGVGFFTKYGDGGVDISPIADLY